MIEISAKRFFTLMAEVFSEASRPKRFLAADIADVHALDFYRALGGVPLPVRPLVCRQLMLNDPPARYIYA